MKITFWKDPVTKSIDPLLFSKTAEAMAKKLADDNEDSKGKFNKRTQIRKFYDEVVRLNMEAKARPKDWDAILPLVHMLVAKAAYARGRNLVSNNFLLFIKSAVNQVAKSGDLSMFANFFEAFMGFYRQHGPSN